MNKQVEQKFEAVKLEFEATEQEISRLTEKQGQLEGQLTRLNLVRQIQNHGVARNRPIWIVNGRNKLEVNSSPS